MMANPSPAVEVAAGVEGQGFGAQLRRERRERRRQAAGHGAGDEEPRRRSQAKGRVTWRFEQPTSTQTPY